MDRYAGCRCGDAARHTFTCRNADHAHRERQGLRMRWTRSLARNLPALLLIAASAALGGCENQELLKWFDNKPKLQGTRVPVFPEGVPGVQQGVPPELLKGYQSQADQQAQAQAAVEEAQKKAEAERANAQSERRQTQQAAPRQASRTTQPSQPRPARQRTQPQPAAAEPEQAAAQPTAAAPQRPPTSAPLADRWPSQQESQPQQQQQQRQEPQPTYSQTRPWPGSESSGPPTDRFR